MPIKVSALSPKKLIGGLGFRFVALLVLLMLYLRVRFIQPVYNKQATHTELDYAKTKTRIHFSCKDTYMKIGETKGLFQHDQLLFPKSLIRKQLFPKRLRRQREVSIILIEVLPCGRRKVEGKECLYLQEDFIPSRFRFKEKSGKEYRDFLYSSRVQIFFFCIS